MRKIFIVYFCLIFILISGCKTVTQKVDEASIKETEKLNKFLQKSETELKIEFGKPDLIEVEDNGNKVLVYNDSKFKIKCERRFEVNQKPCPASISHFKSNKLSLVLNSLNFAQYFVGSSNSTLESDKEVVIKIWG